MWQIAAAKAVGSALDSYAAGSQLKVQKYKAETNAKIVRLNAKVQAKNMQAAYNKSMASNAIIAAAQGRKGGSVQAIASAAERGFNWDLDFAEMNTRLQEIGLQSEIEAYNRAAKYAQGVGMVSAAGISLLSSAQKMGSIGGSSNTSTLTQAEKGFDDRSLYKGGATGWY